MKTIRTILCTATLLVTFGMAHAGQSSWDDLSRRANDAVRSVQQGTGGVNTQRQQVYQDLMNAAAADGRTDVMAWLQGKGADINMTGSDGRTPAQVATRNGQNSVSEWLRRQSGSNTASPYGRSNYSSASSSSRYNSTDDDDVISSWLRGQTSRNSTDLASRGSTTSTQDWLSRQGMADSRDSRPSNTQTQSATDRALDWLRGTDASTTRTTSQNRGSDDDVIANWLRQSNTTQR